MAKGRPRGGSTHVDILIGQRLRSARRLAGISQADLAAAIGVTFQQVQKYEKGTNRIAASRLLQFSIIFDRPVDWFLTGARKTLADEGLKTIPAISEQAPVSLAEHRIFKAGKIICDIPNPKIRQHLLGIAKEVCSGPDSTKAAQ